MRHMIADLPTWTFSEENVVVVLWRSFCKGDARIVLPMPHRLLEESLVSTCNDSDHCYIQNVIKRVALLRRGDARAVNPGGGGSRLPRFWAEGRRGSWGVVDGS